MISNQIESLFNLTPLAEGGSVWMDRKFKDPDSTECILILHNSLSSGNSLGLGQFVSHSDSS
jgi:hypothetical protein